MYINNYFNTTIWSEQKPEFIKSTFHDEFEGTLSKESYHESQEEEQDDN